uniref:Chymotrypsin C n=1 Tax=Pan paniscus TaxID=9597 RepID=A0A2R9AVN1_PANPA
MLTAALGVTTPGPTVWPWERTTWRWKTKKDPYLWVWTPSMSIRDGTPSCCAMTLPSSSLQSMWS